MKQWTKRLFKQQIAGKDSEVNKNKVKAKKLVAVLVDLKEETQKAVAAALATQAQTEREPQLRQQQPDPGPRSVLKEDALEGNTGQVWPWSIQISHCIQKQGWKSAVVSQSHDGETNETLVQGIITQSALAQVAEIVALTKALQLPQGKRVNIYSDSVLHVNGP